MRFGINLINFGPGASPASMAQSAELAESLGYHLVMISDHVAVTPDVHGRYPAPLYNPFTTLGWLAGLTKRVELGTTVVIVPYRHPLETARMVADVDRVSGGRFIFGVGVGWARQEFEALGVPFHHRGAMTNDYLAAIKTRAGRRRSRRTRAASRRSATCARRPRPCAGRIRRSGSAAPAMRPCAARWSTATRGIRSAFASTGCATRACRGSPRSPRSWAARSPPLCPRIRLRLTDAAMPEDRRVAGEGTLDQVRADLAALEALGVGSVLLDTYCDDPEATRDPEAGWRMLRTVAERLVDLPREALR